MVNILVAEPRLLIVMIRSTWVHLMCVVCHGPHKDDPDPDAADAYWKWAAVKVNNHVHNATAVILLTDSNAQWDTTNTASMQHYQHYAHFLETTHITDLVHHDQMVRRSVFTFFTTHDDGIQLDYIGVRGKLDIQVDTYNAIDSFDNGIAKDAHRALAVTLSIRPCKGTVCRSRRTIGYSTDTLQDPQVMDEVLERLSMIKQCDKSGEPYTHVQILDAPILQILVEEAPNMRKKVCRLPYLTKDTFDLILNKALHRWAYR